ncbi:MAG: hypothetical protein IJ560_02250 [Alphaproteobacteria bacterium]|nr:hypothetical protein [Alphaproteobacteria bacterium]
MFGMCIFTNVRAATCDAGYYLNDAGECAECYKSSGHEDWVAIGVYCPGDDKAYECPKPGYDYESILNRGKLTDIGSGPPSWGEGIWVALNLQGRATSVKDCNYRLLFRDEYGNTIMGEGGAGNNYTIGWCANFGYSKTVIKGTYLSGYCRKKASFYIYNAIKNCTNAPANAHYTGVGTPDSPDGTIVDANDCPWECDAGYGHTSDDRCLPLCRIGETAMNGINIYAEKHTKYAMAVPRGAATCWISATRGQGGKLVPTN